MKFIHQFNFVTLIMAAMISFLFSCTSVKSRNEQRELQSEVIRTLNEQTPLFAQCVKRDPLLTKSDQERVRVELILTINDKGQVINFKMDNKDYSRSLIDCMFDIADQTTFPQLQEGHTLELVQPFIFRKK